MEGVYLFDGFVKVKYVKFKKCIGFILEFEMILDEGCNCEICCLFVCMDYKVL